MAETGRPLIFDDPKELEKSISDYFRHEKRPTLSGLAVYLGVGRRTLYEYADREAFSHIIKSATQQVEAKYEERLIYENNPTGVIFALKNMGWKDRSEVENTGGQTIKVVRE